MFFEVKYNFAFYRNTLANRDESAEVEEENSLLEQFYDTEEEGDEIIESCR